MKKNNPTLLLLFLSLLCTLLEFPSTATAQDRTPLRPRCDVLLKTVRPLREISWASDTVSVHVSFPSAFRATGQNAIDDAAGRLTPFLEHLRLLRSERTQDTVRVVHIGDSHVRGHIYPQATGTRLRETFGAVSYTDMGVNGATCLTFTHPSRIEEIVALQPELLILSFGTNESHNRRYNSDAHYRQIDELVRLLQAALPDVPILLTTPPGSYESFRQGRRRRTYTVNPRTPSTVATLCRYARDHDLPVWDLYGLVGGPPRACANWTEASLMRPDHVHYLPEGYLLQGDLLYEALINAYNEYVIR